ncbi:MAG: adenylosuccinate synthetase [Gemmatimonadota bacterium]
MAQRVIILSGRVSSGKSTLAIALVTQYGCVRVRTQELILRALPGTGKERRALQAAGDRLDRKTNGTWIASALAKMLQTLPRDAIVVIDSARIREQIVAIRRASRQPVVHVHLVAPLGLLAERYKARRNSIKEVADYASLSRNATERHVDQLGETADVVIDTKSCSEADVVARVASHLGFYGRSYQRLVDVIIGGGYGSEGKGHIAAHLSPEYDVLVRVGGPNAGHTVYEDPPYTHHQLPSGTRRCEAKLIIGPGAVLDVKKLRQEIADCKVSAERLSIDPQAMIITAADKRWEMTHLRGSISSTAQGGGKATARRVLRGAPQPVQLARDIKVLAPYIRETQQVLDRAFFRGERILLEGTQGTALSLYHGLYPFVTSRDTTVSGCLAEAGIAPSRVRKVVMVCRTYPIRVGGPSGEMGTEISWAEVSRRSGIPVQQLRRAERTSTTNRRRRVAEFDWALLRRAASLNAPTDIALTFTDYIRQENQRARRFEQLTTDTIRFIEEMERVAAAPVSLISTRFEFRSIVDRRRW